MNLADLLDERIGQRAQQDRFFATVTGTSGARVFVQRDGYPAADPVAYQRLASYASPTNGDRVAVARWGGGYLVIGEIA